MMNERIKEFAKLAGFNPYNYEGGNAELFNRFAELIIEECIRLSTEVQKQTVSNGSPDYTSGREMGIEVCINKIKEEFGGMK